MPEVSRGRCGMADVVDLRGGVGRAERVAGIPPPPTPPEESIWVALHCSTWTKSNAPRGQWCQ
jgi:hypothetical protein